MSINQLIEIGRSSLRTAGAGINTAGQNIANAETAGYTRRRIIQEPKAIVSSGIQMRTPWNQPLGAGVGVAAFERVRDALLLSASREARSAVGSSTEESKLLGAIQEMLGPSGGPSLTDALGAYYNAWNDVADHPTDEGVRWTLLSRAETVAGALNRLDTELRAFTDEVRGELQSGVESANGLIDEIAALNVTIREARFSGAPDLEAEDRRDQAIQELAVYMPVKVQDGPNGMAVTVGGISVVQGDHATHLAVSQSPDGKVAVQFAGLGVPYAAPSGEDGRVGAWTRTINTTLLHDDADPTKDGLLTRLDNLARNLVEQTNAAHTAGFDLDGNTGTAFFDPAGLRAGTIRVAVTAPRGVAAAGSMTDALGNTISRGPGDSTTALAVAGLRTGSEREAIDSGVWIGAKARQAGTAASAATASADHLEAMESSLSGVSLDDELANLIQYQQAYAASARILNTAQEMMDTLLSL